MQWHIFPNSQKNKKILKKMTKNFHFPKQEKEKPSCMCIYQKKLPVYVYVSTNSNQQLYLKMFKLIFLG